MYLSIYCLFIDGNVDFWLRYRQNECLNTIYQDQSKHDTDFVVLFRNMTQEKKNK